MPAFLRQPSPRPRAAIEQHPSSLPTPAVPPAALTDRRRKRSMDTRRSVIWARRSRLGDHRRRADGDRRGPRDHGVPVPRGHAADRRRRGARAGVLHPADQQDRSGFGDEFQTLGIRLGDRGEIVTSTSPRARGARALESRLRGRQVTRVGGTLERDRVAIGFDDGTVRSPPGVADHDHAPAQLARPPAARRPRPDAEGAVFTEVGPATSARCARSSRWASAPSRSRTCPIIALDYRVGGTVERPTIAFATVDATASGAGQPLAHPAQHDDRRRRRCAPPPRTAVAEPVRRASRSPASCCRAGRPRHRGHRRRLRLPLRPAQPDTPRCWPRRASWRGASPSPR
jgi:hypothetical protein